MKHLLLILITMILLPQAIWAQRTIENPKYQSKGIGSLKLGIEKVVLTKDVTKLYMNYYLNGSGGFNIGGQSRIVANGKELQVLSAEGIELDGPYIKEGGDDGKRHFVLNFPAIGSNVESIDFIESNNPRAFKIYGIALTDRAAKKIKRGEPIPESIKNFAANVKDDGKDLEPNAFASGEATIKGRVYGYAPGVFKDLSPDKLEVTVELENPYTTKEENFSVKPNEDGTFEVRIPMFFKHQIATVMIRSITVFQNVMLSEGKTVEVYCDLNQMFEPFESTGGRLTAYLAGDNADIGYAFSYVPSYYYMLWSDDEFIKKIYNASAMEFKQHILDYYNTFNAQFDGKDITKRAKQLLKIKNKTLIAGVLSSPDYFLEYAYRHVNNLDNNAPLPSAYNKPVIDENYLDYPVILGMDDFLMFYSDFFPSIIKHWNQQVDGLFGSNNSDKREAYVNKLFGNGDSFFKEFRALQAASDKLDSNIPLSDSELSAIDNMRYKEYGKYFKSKNAEVSEKNEAEKSRGGYYKHVAGENTTDSLFVELLKEFDGKVVFVDFWDTWCGPCRRGMKLIEPVKEEFAGKDVVFLYIADYSSPEEEYNGMIPSIKGKHYRLPNDQVSMLMNKFGFEAIPSYVIIGKDGMVKDFHTGFKGAEYYKAKFEDELNK